MSYKSFFASLLLHSCLFAMGAWAQMDSLLFVRQYGLDSTARGELAVEVDNVTFFQDNEYDRSRVVGYTLPGLWIQPKVTYQPLGNLKVEAGVHSLIYFGKTKYPTVAYQDIGAWKGRDYMEGAHVLPYFRANMCIGKTHWVLGNIYGGLNHRLVEPLYSPELGLTCDPEAGLQMLVDMKHWHLDVWVNWQSFIFRNDTHQEAFTFGGNSELRFGRLTIPVQAVVQHRGGEIQVDSAHVGVQTLINGAVGVRYEQPVATSWLKRLTLEADGLYYLQQSGHMYPLDNGYGIFAKALLDFAPGIRFKLAYLKSKDFVSLFGNGQYSSVSCSDRSTTFRNAQTVSTAIEYSRTFAGCYTFGARAEAYYFTPNSAVDCNFGVYMKINPKFIIKKFF